MNEIKIVLAEDHQIVREGTRQMLEQEEGFLVIGEAQDGESTVQMALELLPDIVVMDVRMPKMNGIEATRRIKAANPSINILILSAYHQDNYVFPLLDAGANGYILKTTSGAQLAQAIRLVCAGQVALDPDIAWKVVKRGSNNQANRANKAIEDLTQREIDILKVVAKGKSNREISDELFISPFTVQVHLSHIFDKLGVDNRIKAVVQAVALGLISIDENTDTPK